MNEKTKKYTEWASSTARIKVTGRGQFPMDMLRHDAAWPATTTDAFQILAKGQRSIGLVVQNRRFFTPDRWESFGWTAEDLEPFFAPEEPEPFVTPAERQYWK